jgi:hypothetical protein
MAKIKYSALVSGMRGKLNGSVMSSNRSGDYIRNKVTPTNPQTASQVQKRSYMTLFSQAWRALSEAQRQAWQGAVSSWSTTDVFGDVKNPTGSTLFTKLNIRLANVDQGPIDVPPLQEGVDLLALDSVTVDATTSEIELTSFPGTVPTNANLIIEATPGMSPGIYNANNKFRIIKTLAASATVGGNIYADYAAKFGAPVAGQKIFFRIRTININTAEVSQKTSGSTLVTV